MKAGTWMLSGLLFVTVTAGACWAASAEETPAVVQPDVGLPVATEAAIEAQVGEEPLRIAGRAAGARAQPSPLEKELEKELSEVMREAGARGGLERLPQLMQAIRDVIALREINRAAMNADQIGRILPVLQKLAKEQGMGIDAALDSLLALRTELLKEKGSSPKPGTFPPLRQQIQSFRERRAAEAMAELGKIITAPQVEILAQLLSPRFLEPDQLVKLLEEKLAALRASK